MHEPAGVVLGDLDVGDAGELAQPLLRDAKDRGEVTGEVHGGAPPQLSERVVPDHGGLVVEALQAERLAEARVVLVVHLPAGQPDAVLADGCVAPRAAAAGFAVFAEWAGVDVPEAWCGQCGEHERVGGHAVGYALAAAHAGADQVVGVLTVALRAGRADRLAPVAARLAQYPVRLAVR